MTSDPSLKRDFIAFLSECIYERRVSQIQRVLESRTRYITVVLEDIYQSQNASAVLRTCDCLGLQDIHIIEDKHCFNVNPQVVLGSNKWLTIKKYKNDSNNSIKAMESLRNEGYRIVATSPHTKEVSLEHFDLHKGKVALFFGTELSGLSKSVLSNADEFISIPMYGFTESFNISVSAAIVLYSLIKKLRDSDILYQLSTDEKENLLLLWLKATTKKWEMMEKRFLLEKNIESLKKY
ncbi:MAG: RNA methyltransferase [Bacteroidales bacterium]|nr:RNA methyltransferase [Bacteroidales bacterium]